MSLLRKSNTKRPALVTSLRFWSRFTPCFFFKTLPISSALSFENMMLFNFDAACGHVIAWTAYSMWKQTKHYIGIIFRSFFQTSWVQFFADTLMNNVCKFRILSSSSRVRRHLKYAANWISLITGVLLQYCNSLKHIWPIHHNRNAISVKLLKNKAISCRFV